MARKGTRQFEARLHDALSDSEIVLYYNLPTTRDRVEFENNLVKRNKGEIESDLVEEQIELGLRLITGFREGDFEREVDGEWVPLSSDSRSEHYVADWKGWLRDYAGDLLESFVIHVFRRGMVQISSSARRFDEGK